MAVPNVDDKVRVLPNNDYDAPWITEADNFDGIYFAGRIGTVVNVNTTIARVALPLPDGYGGLFGGEEWAFRFDEIEVVNE